MFTSFDEKAFYQAIKDKDYLCLKVNTVSSMLDDPTFERGETMKVLQILEEQVPEIFEEYSDLEYEERLDRSVWDKRYFTKLTYWFEENFSKNRVAYIREVGKVVHEDTARQYAESMAIQNKPTKKPKRSKGKKSAKSTQKPEQANSNSRSTTTQPRKTSPISGTEQKEKKSANFPVAGAILAVGALVLIGILLFKVLAN